MLAGDKRAAASDPKLEAAFVERDATAGINDPRRGLIAQLVRVLH